MTSFISNFAISNGLVFVTIYKKLQKARGAEDNIMLSVAHWKATIFGLKIYFLNILYKCKNIICFKFNSILIFFSKTKL